MPQDSDVSFEDVKKFIHEERYTISVSTTASLSLELANFDKVLHLLGSRYWSLITAADGAPDFVTCDHPVVPVFKDPNRSGPVGYGLPHTEVTFPLNTRQVLLGVFEDPLALKIEARPSQVAAVNSRTVKFAERQVYSKSATVTVLGDKGIFSL